MLERFGERGGPDSDRERGMPMTRRLIRLALLRKEGFTLLEVLTAMAILTLGLVGVATAVALQTGGVASSFPFGQAAVTRGYYISAAIMLAQERLEDVTRLTYTVNSAGAVTNPYGADGGIIPAFDNDNPVVGAVTFSRSVKVSTPFGGQNIKQLTVTVTFTLPGELGSSQESVKLSSLVSARPI